MSRADKLRIVFLARAGLLLLAVLRDLAHDTHRAQLDEAEAHLRAVQGDES